ncbi:MAG: hypothetical protein NTV22_15145 [bacterium]|nr:hypothetical protein [bacterium]
MSTLLRCACLALFMLSCGLHADVLIMADGRVISNCYVRDWGTCIDVWPTLAAVGTPPITHPRSAIKSYTVARDAAWDAKPALPDLSVTFIELNPKLPGLHGNIQYDDYGRPTIAGARALSNIGARAIRHPEEAVAGLQFTYTPGQLISATAHVKNLGFAPSKPFEYAWAMDDTPLQRGKYAQPLGEMAEATFALAFPWRTGFHTLTFAVTAPQQEIATINNSVTDPLWGMAYTYVVNNGRIKAWHQARTAYGTFSFEDFYRWHVDMMNRLFEASIYPAAPSGILARVRLDRIISTDDVDKATRGLFAPNGLRYDQGGWVWTDAPEELRTGNWSQTDPDWRNHTEWSLPHELGHQLGLPDWYALDYPGDAAHTMADTGEQCGYFMNHPVTMMHSHGPQPYSEADAGYLNMTWDKPRGYFGDLYFAIPRTVRLRVLDINGQPLGNAHVDIFQRGVKVNTNAPVTNGAACWRGVVEDGDFDQPLSAQPVISGRTDADGVLTLPNRPAEEVRTLNGFYRQANPFGNINVVGNRGMFLVRVTRDAATAPADYWITIYDMCVAWFRGARDEYTVVLRTPFGSPDAPPAPRAVAAKKTDAQHAQVTWTAPPVRERNYLECITGYRVYRRIGNDGLNTKPWFPIATLAPAARSFTADLTQEPENNYFFSRRERFGVSSIGENGIESDITSCVLAAP